MGPPAEWPTRYMGREEDDDDDDDNKEEEEEDDDDDDDDDEEEEEPSPWSRSRRSGQRTREMANREE